MTAGTMLTWELLTVGERLGPYRYVCSADVVDLFRAAIGDTELLELDGVALAPPALLTFPFLQLVETWYDARPGTVHARQDFTLLAPLRVGAELTVTGVLTSMHLKRGRRYYEVQASATDELGVEVATSTTLGIYPDVDVVRSA